VLAIRDLETGEALLLTVPECARMLRMSAREVNRAISRGALGSVKIGRLRRVSRPQLTAFVTALERQGEAWIAR
jgi:excisionase family DNA binding protein